MDDFSLSGKRIAIFGASQGLGAAAAHALAHAGARLALGARDGAALRALKIEGAFAAACDATDPTALAVWAKAALAHLGGLDGLLVTLTAGRSGSLEADFDASFAVDLKAPLQIFAALRPALEAARGAVVFCSSRTTMTAIPQTMAYGSAKAALEYATRCLAAQHMAKGLRINAVAPGSTLTKGGFWAVEQAADSALWHKTLAMMPQGRLAEAGDILGPLLFLLSDHARWITGQTLLIDGGQSLFPYAPK